MEAGGVGADGAAGCPGGAGMADPAPPRPVPGIHAAESGWLRSMVGRGWPWEGCSGARVHTDIA